MGQGQKFRKLQYCNDCLLRKGGKKREKKKSLSEERHQIKLLKWYSLWFLPCQIPWESLGKKSIKTYLKLSTNPTGGGESGKCNN